MARKKKLGGRVMVKVPPFTQSVDAKIPTENVVLSHYMAETKKWFAVSQAIDSSIHIGIGNTEPLARRIAGLKTLQYLESLANGEIKSSSEGDIESARNELINEFDYLYEEFRGVNFIELPISRDEVLIQLKSSRDLIECDADRLAIARLAVPILKFLSLAFAGGVVGVYAERCLELAEKFLSLVG